MKCMHMKTFLLRTSNCRRSTLPSNFAYSTPGLELKGIQALVSKVKRILVWIMSGVTRPLSSRLYICLCCMVRDEPQHALATCCSSNSNSYWWYWFHRDCCFIFFSFPRSRHAGCCYLSSVNWLWTNRWDWMLEPLHLETWRLVLNDRSITKKLLPEPTYLRFIPIPTHSHRFGELLRRIRAHVWPYIGWRGG